MCVNLLLIYTENPTTSCVENKTRNEKNYFQQSLSSEEHRRTHFFIIQLIVNKYRHLILSDFLVL